MPATWSGDEGTAPSCLQRGYGDMDAWARPCRPVLSTVPACIRALQAHSDDGDAGFRSLFAPTVCMAGRWTSLRQISRSPGRPSALQPGRPRGRGSRATRREAGRTPPSDNSWTAVPPLRRLRGRGSLRPAHSAASDAGELRPPRPAGGARAQAPPLGRVRGRRGVRGGVASSRQQQSIRERRVVGAACWAVLLGARAAERSGLTARRTRARGGEAAAGGCVSSGGGGEHGGGLGQAVPGGVRQERARLLQEVQREHPQGLAAHGHHGAGAAALCAPGRGGRAGGWAWRRRGRRGARRGLCGSCKKSSGNSLDLGAFCLVKRRNRFCPRSPGGRGRGGRARGPARRVRLERPGSGGFCPTSMATAGGRVF